MPNCPNILLVMTDQQRADFSRANGYPLDPTPTADRLGQAGARFPYAYTPMPTCGPARTSLLTGRYPKATGVRENSALHLARSEANLVGTLGAHGYRTILAGKNHSSLPDDAFDWSSTYMHTGGGRDDRRTPEDAGFDAWLKSLDHTVYPAPSPFPLERQQPYRIVSDAIAAVDEQPAADPWFMWLSFPEPHNPYQCPEPYHSMFPEADIPPRVAGPEALAAKTPTYRWLRNLAEDKRPGYDDDWLAYRRIYLGMIRMIDDQLARFLDHLGATGQLANTLVIVCSDHGDYAGDYGLQRKGAGLPECLVRVPLVIAGPGIVPSPAPRHEYASLVDLYPTLCEMLGIEIPVGVQGRSLWPILAGESVPEAEFRSAYAELGIGALPWPEDARPPLHFPYEGATFDELNSVTQAGNVKMVRMGEWKLIVDAQGHGELYHLPTDPAEIHNRYNHPADASTQLALTTELLLWTIRTDDELPVAAYSRNRHPRNWRSSLD